jgi:DNA-binding transcriptional regulator GbsR (MarR family)
MPREPSQNLDSTVIFIGGKKTTVGDVQKSYATTGFLSKASAMRVVQVLFNAKEPMTRKQIAEQAKLSEGYSVDVLNNLIQYNYVVTFHIAKRKLLFYALTEKGYNAFASKSEGVIEK